MREGDVVAPRDAALGRWEDEARALRWRAPFREVWSPHGCAGRGTWFPDGELNVAENCVDRHAHERGDAVAIRWEGEPGERRTLTYGELDEQVTRLAAALTRLGVRPGDVVALHMSLLPETVIAMLACARLGAPHAVLPSTLPADALADRLAVLAPRLLVTQDGAWRHGLVIPLKARADEALAATSGVEHTVVVRRTGMDVGWFAGDRWFADLLAEADGATAPSPALPSEHPLLIAQLANRRGRPRGIVHASAGYLTYAAAVHRHACTQDPDDVLWCPVDIGWLAGQTHGVYGPLACGATTVLFEGMVDTPTHARAWQVIERERVSSLLTTPSVARNLRTWVDSPPSEHDLSSLRRIITAGEAIDEGTRGWLHEAVGGHRADVLDGWGQTELGAVVSFTGAALDPGPPDPGLHVVDSAGQPVPAGSRGELALAHPWPGTYLHDYGEDGLAPRRVRTGPLAGPGEFGAYLTGDAARHEGDGAITVLERLDQVVSVAGQVVSTAEVREVLEEHPFVAAAEVVSRPDPRSGRAVCAFVRVHDEAEPSARTARELRSHVYETLGGLAQPKTIGFLPDVPDDVPRPHLRRALEALAAARTGITVTVMHEQLAGALAAAADPGDGEA